MLYSNLRVRKRNFWLSSPTQLVGAILICVALPFAVQAWWLPVGFQGPEAGHAALAALLAVTAGFWLYRSLSALPGTRESSGILPAYSITFGIALTVILLFRIHYSRALLVLGYLLTLVWFHVLYLVTQRRATLVLGVVEGGSAHLFDGMNRVIPVCLGIDDSPEGMDAVAADFRFPHSAEWEARIADLVLSGIPVYHSKDLHESLSGRADLEHLSENTFGVLAPLAPFQIAKQVVDRVAALPAFVVLLPLFLLTAIAIKLDSAGPVFFRQRRIGYRGKEFEVIKFRTMQALNKRPRLGSRDEFITREGDQRITRVGQFLRRTRIDELPQIINILRGEMSWIGPRPEASALSEWYEQEIPFYRYRHVVVPGITGWAQVSQGHVAEIDDVRRKLQYDFYYIRNFSVWMDLLIVAKTIKTVLTGFGSK